MKKLFFSACAALALTACTQAPKTVITAELTNADDQKVYITERVDGKYIQTDSIDMVGGKFTMTTTNVYPRQAIITFASNPRLGHFFTIEEGNISIKGDFNDFQNIATTGTKTAELLTALNAELAPFKEQMDQVSAEFNAINRDSITPEELAAKTSELRAKYEGINNQLEATQEAAIEKNLDNVFGASLLSQKRLNTFEEVEAILAKVSPNMPANKYIDDLKILKDKLAAIKIGVVAPDFTVTTPEGTEISLSSLKGQVVLVDFWASWCGPCRATNPSVVALYNKYKEAGFTVFGVSLDTDKDKWLEAIATDSLTWNHGSDLKGWEAAPAALYNITGIPHTFLLDKEGKIVGDNLHGEELEAKVAELTAVAPAATETPAAK